MTKRIYATENIIFPQGREYIDLVGNGCAESKNSMAVFTPVPPPYRGPWQLRAQLFLFGKNWLEFVKVSYWIKYIKYFFLLARKI